MAHDLNLYSTCPPGIHSMSTSGVNAKLLRRIQRACRPTREDPDLGLNLEIVDLINEKQGSLPRQAAVAIVKLINSRDPQTSELAISLLDHCVKNCGYPFHLQISRKEFLNELVKKFPERPPMRYTRVQRLILTLIEEWTQTLCRNARYKEDLGFIRDMHRLLGYKGYNFPEVRSEDAAVLNPSDNLKSLQELQKEEELVHSAKLQELIRRGRPGDLKEANKLMKIMSGFQQDAALAETRQQVAEDLQKLERKIEVFSDMLNSCYNAGKLDETDETIAELYSSLKTAQPKIQKLIQEENDDEDAVTKLLALNDNIHKLLERYTSLKSGDTSGSADLNLIDFGAEDSSPQPTASVSASAPSNDVIDLLSDLNSLSFDSNKQQNFGLGGSINLNFPTADQAQPKTPQLDPFNLDFSNVQTPPPAPMSANRSLIHQSSHLKLDVERQAAGEFVIHFSNPSHTQISDLQFLVALPKKWDLNLSPQSGNTMGANSVDGITQQMSIKTKNNEPSTGSVKFKWRCNYSVGGSETFEEGVNTITL